MSDSAEESKPSSQPVAALTGMHQRRPSFVRHAQPARALITAGQYNFKLHNLVSRKKQQQIHEALIAGKLPFWLLHLGKLILLAAGFGLAVYVFYNYLGPLKFDFPDVEPFNPTPIPPNHSPIPQPSPAPVPSPEPPIPGQCEAVAQADTEEIQQRVTLALESYDAFLRSMAAALLNMKDWGNDLVALLGPLQAAVTEIVDVLARVVNLEQARTAATIRMLNMVTAALIFLPLAVIAWPIFGYVWAQLAERKYSKLDYAQKWITRCEASAKPDGADESEGSTLTPDALLEAAKQQVLVLRQEGFHRLAAAVVVHTSVTLRDRYRASAQAAELMRTWRDNIMNSELLSWTCRPLAIAARAQAHLLAREIVSMHGEFPNYAVVAGSSAGRSSSAYTLMRYALASQSGKDARECYLLQDVAVLKSLHQRGHKRIAAELLCACEPARAQRLLFSHAAWAGTDNTWLVDIIRQWPGLFMRRAGVGHRPEGISDTDVFQQLVSAGTTRQNLKFILCPSTDAGLRHYQLQFFAQLPMTETSQRTWEEQLTQIINSVDSGAQQYRALLRFIYVANFDGAVKLNLIEALSVQAPGALFSSEQPSTLTGRQARGFADVDMYTCVLAHDRVASMVMQHLVRAQDTAGAAVDAWNAATTAAVNVGRQPGHQTGITIRLVTEALKRCKANPNDVEAQAVVALGLANLISAENFSRNMKASDEPLKSFYKALDEYPLDQLPQRWREGEEPVFLNRFVALRIMAAREQGRLSSGPTAKLLGSIGFSAASLADRSPMRVYLNQLVPPEQQEKVRSQLAQIFLDNGTSAAVMGSSRRPGGVLGEGAAAVSLLGQPPSRA